MSEVKPVPKTEAPESEVPPAPPSGTAAELVPKGKRTSGYRRLQGRHRHLIEVHERSQESHDRLEQDYRQLEAAFEEVTALNAQLAAELRAAKQRSVQYGAHMLMGT
jgi:hypothetical protein